LLGAFRVSHRLPRCLSRATRDELKLPQAEQGNPQTYLCFAHQHVAPNLRIGKQSIINPHRPSYARLRIALIFFLVLVCAVAPAQITTPPAIAIPLLLPSAVVFDSTGNLYFAEIANHVIRKVDTTGRLTTIAGTGTQGFSGDGGPATAAALDSPQGLALDTTGNLYLADTHNHRIRKLNLATGLITTIAGTGTPGFSGDGASATAAQLDLPTALALDSASNLYFADTANHRIRRIAAATGLITTIAGTGTQGISGDNGPATQANIDSPQGLAFDSANNLYLADTHNHLIRRINAATGLITTIAGTGTLGFSGDTNPATNATLALPQGLTIDVSGNLYFADTANHRIRRIDATTGLITTIAGDGTQGFSGDNGPATAASLDSPRSTTLSSAAALTLADTGNGRIRQLNATTITTIAGLGDTTPGTLALTAPSVVAYGTGQLTASLASSTSAIGSVTFFDTIGTTVTTLGTVPLNTNAAIFPTSNLPAGQHSLTATYPGDQTHLSAQTPVLLLTIAPAQLLATINPVTLPYGAPIPAIKGAITGILTQDASTVTATFTTTAVPLSPAATYPITVNLTGPAAGNYTVAPVVAAVTIIPAPTLVTLTDLIATAASGSTTTLTTLVSSTTTGTPTGTITLLDGPTPIATQSLSTTGSTVFTLNSLSTGTHSFTAIYNGGKNFTPSDSLPQQVTIGIGATPDFTLAATGTITQTTTPGTATTFTFAVQPIDSLSSPINLTAIGLPNFSTTSFSPSYIPPGGQTTFTLTINTPSNTQISSRTPEHRTPPITWAILFLPILGLATRKRPIPTVLCAIVILSLSCITGCGDRINSESISTTPAKTYPITVTGTATSSTGSTLTHSATVTLILQSTN
jgi:sugar lactone lactonase YvrE